MTLTFGTHEASLFKVFPVQKSIGDRIWPCCKIGQGQLRVFIWTNLVVLEHSMLHTKFQGHRPFGSGKEDFFKVFTIYGHGGHLGHVNVWTNFCSPIPRRLHMKFGFNRPSGFRGEDVLKSCHTHIHTFVHYNQDNTNISNPSLAHVCKGQTDRWDTDWCFLLFSFKCVFSNCSNRCRMITGTRG